MDKSETISRNRLKRLSQSKCLLGEPDIMSITHIKLQSSFFLKDKKIEEIQQNFINGLIFPTTAHLSSFISSRYQVKDQTKTTVRAKLYIFDAFGQKDIQIEINMPGSLQIKTYNLKGQLLPLQGNDYQRGYYSSFLRSLYPMNYANIMLYPLISRLQIIKTIIKHFISFSCKNELRELNYDYEKYRNEYLLEMGKEELRNLSIQILIHYCLENKFQNLIQIILAELKKSNPLKHYELDIEFKLKQKKYKEVIARTAQKLIMHPQLKRLKEYQIKALYPIKKYSDVANIGKSLFESGGTNYQTSKLILSSYIQLSEQKRFMKCLNLTVSMHNQNQKNVIQVSHESNNTTTVNLDIYVTRTNCISEYPELCFPFDNQFINRQQQYKALRSQLKKSQKERSTHNLMENVEKSLNTTPSFYELLIAFEKQKSWKQLLKMRSECFWLECDFINYEQSIKSKSNTLKESYPSEQQYLEQDKKEETSNGDSSFSIPSNLESQSQNKRYLGNLQESFDGNLSQHEQVTDVVQLPKCSTRVYTTRKQLEAKKSQSKILCSNQLEKLFLLLFNDIKLQNSLQSWQQKCKQTNSNYFSLEKRQLTATILIKKGFLHKKLQRNRKCEQSFKLARKLSQSFAINIVASYQLILLYIDNKNVKGVEFYLVELIKIIKSLGIDSFNIVPEWAKPIMQYVIDSEGLAIIKNIHGLFKNVIFLYLRSNYTEEDVEKLIQLKKDKK